MTTNSIREVMGLRLAAGGKHTSHPILETVVARESTVFPPPELRELIINAPWMEGIINNDSLNEGAMANAIALWIQTHIITAVRGEALAESESVAKEKVKNLEKVIDQMREENRTVTGYGRPEEINQVFLKRIEGLIKCITDEAEIEGKILGIEKEISSKKDNLFQKEGDEWQFRSDDEITKKVESMEKIKSSLSNERKTIKRRYVKHLMGGEEKQKGEKVFQPRFPKNVLSLDVETFCAKFGAWFNYHLHEYYALAPYILHIMTSYDVKEGCFWKPPHVREIPAEILEVFVENGERMCRNIQAEVDVHTWGRVTRNYTYGLENQCAMEEMFLDGDAPRLVHCILTTLNENDISSVVEIESQILAMPHKFKRGNPRKGVEEFQKLLKKASRVNADVPFRVASQLAVTLNHRHPSFSDFVKEYETLPPRTVRNKCGSLIYEMLNKIERRCNTAMLYQDSRVERLAGEEELLRLSETSGACLNINRGKEFGICVADNCTKRVCEDRRGKVKPYPPHTCGLCLDHYIALIRNKFVKMKNGQYRVSKKDESGKWQYGSSSVPPPKERSQKGLSLFVSESDEIVNNICEATEVKEEKADQGDITIEDLRMMEEHVASRKRKRAGSDSSGGDYMLLQRSEDYVEKVLRSNKDI